MELLPDKSYMAKQSQCFQGLQQCVKRHEAYGKESHNLRMMRSVSEPQRPRETTANRLAKSKSVNEKPSDKQSSNMDCQYLLKDNEDTCQRGLNFITEKLQKPEDLADLRKKLEVLLNSKFAASATGIQDVYIDYSSNPARIVVNISKGSLYKVQQVLQQVSEDLDQFFLVEQVNETHYLSDIADPLSFLKDMKNQLTVFLNCNFRTQHTGIQSFYIDEAEPPLLIIDVTKGKKNPAEDVIKRFIWEQNHIALMNYYTIIEQDNEFEYCSWEPGRAMGVETQGPIQAGRIGSSATSGECNFILTSCHLVNRTHPIHEGPVTVLLPAGPVPTTYKGVRGIYTNQPEGREGTPAVDIAAIAIPDNSNGTLIQYHYDSIYKITQELPIGETLYMERLEEPQIRLKCEIYDTNSTTHIQCDQHHFFVNQVLSVTQPIDADKLIKAGDSGAFLWYDNGKRQGIAIVNECRRNSTVFKRDAEGKRKEKIVAHQIFAVYINNCLNALQQCHNLELTLTPSQRPTVEELVLQ